MLQEVVEEKKHINDYIKTVTLLQEVFSFKNKNKTEKTLSLSLVSSRKKNKDGEKCFNQFEWQDPVRGILSNYAQVHFSKWLMNTWRVIHD